MVNEVWIPLRSYKLILKHRLLNELGEISYFILKALHQTPLTLADFESITGLSEHQIKPVWERLKGLRLIDSQGQLTKPSGESIAYILENLHQKTVYFWLDRRYHTEKKFMLMIKRDSSLVNVLPKAAIKIEPKSSERDWDTECFSQTERLRKNIHDVLLWLFPVFSELPNIETMKWGQEWELDLKVDNSFSDGYGLPIELDFISQTDEKPVISLFTKVLALETRFELADGVDFGKSLECPDVFKFQYSFAEESFYRDLIYVDNADSDKILECLEDIEDKEIAMELLKLCHEETNERHSMFNRLHKFYNVWQQHNASWLQVCNHIPKTDDVYKTYVQGDKIENN